MAFYITIGELEYVHSQLYAGKAYKIFAALTGSLTINDTIADWEAAELPTANGYQAATGTIGNGTYDNATGKFKAPTITWQFKGNAAGFTYDAVIIKLAGRTKPHAVNLLEVPQVLAAGQVKPYSYTFLTKQ